MPLNFEAGSEAEASYVAAERLFQIDSGASVEYLIPSISRYEVDSSIEVSYFAERDAGFYVDSVFSTGYEILVNDVFSRRYLLSVFPITEPLAGTRVGESSTSYAWYELSFAESPQSIRVSLSGATGTLTVYRATDQLNESDDYPSSATQLTSIATGAGPLDIDLSENDWDSLYIRVSSTHVNAQSLILSVQDSSPTVENGGVFEAPIDIAGEWGTVSLSTVNAPLQVGEPDNPSVSGETGSAWARWTSPASPPGAIFFSLGAVSTAPATGIRIFTGNSLGTLVQVAGTTAGGAGTAEKIVSFTPVADTQYYIQVVSVAAGGGDYRLSWYPQAVVVAPAAVPQHARVVAYTLVKDGFGRPTGALQQVSEIPRRTNVQFQANLNEAGSGTISVPLSDPIFKAHPTILDNGNIIKIWFGSKCVFGFVIKKTETVFIGSNDWGSQAVTASGPSFEAFLNDFIIYHDPSSSSLEGEDRSYSWASPPGEWYNPAQWNHKIMRSSQKDPPGDWKKKPKKRAKYGFPRKWTDKNSVWFWIHQKKNRNGGWNPPFGVTYRYYRRIFSVKNDGQRYRFYLTADDQAMVYIDGEQFFGREKNNGRGYKAFSYRDIVLKKGTHQLAVYVLSVPNGKKEDGVDAFMLTVREVNNGKKGKIVNRTGAKNAWNAFYGAEPPTWNKAMVLRSVVNEAKARASSYSQFNSSHLLTLGFTKDRDSWGNLWTGRLQMSFKVGTSCYDLVQQLSEGGYFDVAVDPETLALNAWIKRIRDRSASVALVPGRNLLDFSISSSDTVVNTFYTHYDDEGAGGWIDVQEPTSIRTAIGGRAGRREMLVELGGVRTAPAARDIMLGAAAGIASSLEKAGSPDITLKQEYERNTGSILGVPGAFPFLDWEIGDVISAPSGQAGQRLGTYLPYRVLSLSCTEDQEGRLTFDAELEPQAESAPVR